jgi:hypothetical protein
VATFGAASWILNKDIAKRLTACDRKILRIMFGEINASENCRKPYDADLMQLFGGLNILSFVCTSRLNWIGHVSRMNSTRKVRSSI